MKATKKWTRTCVLVWLGLMIIGMGIMNIYKVFFNPASLLNSTPFLITVLFGLSMVLIVEGFYILVKEKNWIVKTVREFTPS